MTRSATRMRTKAEATAALRDADTRLAEALPLHDVEAIVSEAEHAVAVIADDAPRISPITGEQQANTPKLARIRRENLLRSFQERRALLRGALSVNEVAQLLGVRRQTPHDRARAGTLLCVKENGRLLFPAWQFDADGPDGVLAGLPQALQAMKGPISPIGRIRWFSVPKSLLDGRTPLQALRAGDVDQVIAEAEAIGIS